MDSATKEYLKKLKTVKKFLTAKGYTNWVVVGSGAVFMTGLLNRYPHDVDMYIIGEDVYDTYYADERKKWSAEFTVDDILVHIYIAPNFDFMNVVEIEGIKFGMNIARTFAVKAAWGRDKDIADIDYAIQTLQDIKANTPPIIKETKE
jgi:hypothetical protein